MLLQRCAASAKRCTLVTARDILVETLNGCSSLSQELCQAVYCEQPYWRLGHWWRKIAMTCGSSAQPATFEFQREVWPTLNSIACPTHMDQILIEFIETHIHRIDDEVEPLDLFLHETAPQSSTVDLECQENAEMPPLVVDAIMDATLTQCLSQAKP